MIKSLVGDGPPVVAGHLQHSLFELVGMPPSLYRERTAGTAKGIPACLEKQVTRPIRNREASVTELHLA
ncbi:hypothetical protein A4G28_06305 [Mycobacterium ostraviense]|uniref:Uncharacterized protein n=1 Tax=Mycobacterium ostraviense TaxID=2738409 RepID=A0A164AXG2_9MYCO|nr:hypothetical protein A4G28_06305 [Mycobacterium ostraviense]